MEDSELQDADAQVGAVWSGTACDGSVRWVAADLRPALEGARVQMDLGPLATLAFSQATLSACLLLRSSTKRAEEIHVDLRGDGSLGRVVAEFRADGSFRGFVGNAHATGDAPSDVSLQSGIGRGLMKVRRVDRQRGGTYESNVGLVQGELALDLAHYLDQSEQRQAAVLLATQVDSNGLTCATGYLLDALPDARAGVISEIERRIASLPALSDWIREHPGRSGIERLIPGRLELGTETRALYACRCSRESLEETLRRMDQVALQDLFGNEAVLVADCAYCGEQHRFDHAELLTSN